MKKTLRFVLTALFFITALQAYCFDNMNRQIGIIYLKNAAVYYLNGQYDRAEELLEKTSEFQDDSSDYEYLYGMIRLERDNRLNDAEENFRKAIDNRNWILFDKKECVTDLSLILFRKKQYKRLIDIVENEYFPDYNDNDLMYLYLLSLRYQNQEQKYSTMLKRSIERYSDDYRFAMLYVSESRSYAKRVISGLYQYSSPEGAQRALYKAAMTLDDGNKRLRALEEYFKSGGKDKQAMIEYYRLRGGITDSEFTKLIEGGFFENPVNRLRLSDILTENEMRQKLDDAYESYTGNVYYDFNEDGYFEELHLFEYGNPVGLSIDMDQDGVIEVMIIFDSGKPAEVMISNESFIRISYDEYPAIKEISFSNGTERDVYSLLRDKIMLEVCITRDSDGKIVYLGDNVEKIIGDTAALSENSVRVSSYTGGDEKDNYGYLANELERMDEYFSILKIYNKIIGNYIYQQVNDKRTLGFADLDYDNLIDLRESYSEGRLISIEADDNKNGVYDYKITFEDGNDISWWDFDEDGIYDCRQFLENGVLINEYSSGFDGVFDIIERN